MKISDVDPRELLRMARRRVKRIARRTVAVRYRSIVVPLLGREETDHAVDLACRLAADRRARVVLVAPLVVEPELPLNAQFPEETAALRAQLDEAAAIAESYGVGARKRLVRTRGRALGYELAEVAHDHRAELIVIGAPVESRRGFRRAFPPEIFSVLREAPCRVMVATGPVAGGAASRAPAGAAV
jgi:nucleotide-binding universal stress UspA family protein